MVLPRRRVARRALRRRAQVGRRRGQGRRRLPLSRNPQVVGGPNTCKVIETQTLTLLANNAYIVSMPGIVGTRPQAIAPNFGLYRIAKMMFKYKATSDTFVSNPAFIGGAGAVTVPHLYWKMNRFADLPAAFTAQNLRDLGAKPFRLDDKTVTVAYKPNILLSSASAGTDSGQLKMTPWLNTDSAPDTGAFVLSTTHHYGHFFIIDCSTNGNGATPVATVDITIVYEFKNPRTNWSSSESGAPEVRRLADSLTSGVQVLPTPILDPPA